MAALLVALLLWASLAHAVDPLLLDGFDTADDSTTTATDALDWTETRHASAVDADIRLDTSTIHNAASGGSDTSRHALRAAVSTTGRWVRYTRTTAFTDMGTATMAFSLRIASGAEPTGGRRTVACLLESDADPTTDPGCCLVADTDRSLQLVYMGSNEGACTPDADDADCDADEVCMGSVCRKLWIDSAETVTANSCSSDKTIPCSSAGDCPATEAVPSPACDQDYWVGVELGQTVVGSGSVICRLRLNGRVVSENAIETPITGSPVENVVNAALGVLDYGSTAGTATFNIDDFVMDASSRAGYGYIATLVPSGPGAANQWTVDSLCTSSTAWSCVDDWGITPYSYDTGLTTNRAMRAKKPGLTQDFARLQAGGAVALGDGETVPAVEAVIVARGATAGDATDRTLTQSLLVCDNATGTACGTATECCAEESAVYTIPDTTDLAVYRFLSTESPKPGFRSWGNVINSVGLRQRTTEDYVDAAPARTSYVGAAAVYARVQKPDRHEARTFLDHNKGSDDNVHTIAFIGDSTAQGTVQLTCLGGTNQGGLCAQQSYCSWDSLENGGFQDLPVGGCFGSDEEDDGAADDANCFTCTVGSGGGVTRACSSGTCDFGICGAEVAGKCEDDTSVSCSTDDDCDATCDTAATCEESCPGGSCPTALAGWPSAAALRIDADVLINCGMGAEDTGQMFESRYDAILDGRGKVPTSGSAGCLPGVAGVTCCTAMTGSGTCTCDSNDDCGSGGSCSGGLCVAGGAEQLTCTSGAQCDYAGGHYCQFPRPDYIVTLEGYNDQFYYAYQESQSHLLTYFDAECETLASAFAEDNGPLNQCPQFGSGAYERPSTKCEQTSDCAGISPTSDCLGRCWAGDNGCMERGQCFGGGNFCVVDAPACDSDADCPVASGASVVRTCTGERTDAPGLTLEGYCTCTANNQCPTNYVCVGTPSGKKVCRRSCTVDGGCSLFGLASTCDTTTCGGTDGGGTCDAAGTSFCVGRCTIPCNAISCKTDGDCGGTTSSQRWGGLRTGFYRGKCNQAAGKCACCGTVSCNEHPSLMARGCSCSSDGDCGASGDCENNECIAGTKATCDSPDDCPGFQCMRCDEQYLQYARTHEGLYAEVAQRMQKRIDSLPESDGRPVLVFSALPMTSGLLTSDDATLDRACTSNYSHRAYFARSYEELRAVLPDHRVVDQSDFNEGRTALAYHTDIVHFSVLGATAAGVAVADTLNRLNVCVNDSTGLAQEYCQNLNGSNSLRCTCDDATDCGTGGVCTSGFCTGGDSNKVECTGLGTASTCDASPDQDLCMPPTCDADLDCPSDEVCGRRACNGDAANCPASGDSCNPD